MAQPTNKTPKILPHPGYILAKLYVPPGIFKPAATVSGEDLFYEVLQLGENIIDSEGIERKPNCRIGDIVIGVDSSSTFELEHVRYYFLHFTQVHGIYGK